MPAHALTENDRRQRSVRFWKRARIATRWLLVLCVFLAVWLLAFGGGEDELAVLPDTEPQFSLDLRVTGQADHTLVYAVEQRARPAYRIFEFDPQTGDVTTVFTVPDDAIIYGIALSPDRTQLAVAYSPDFHMPGSGVWTLDLASGAFTEIIAVVTDVYLTEPEWTGDGSTILATHVDRRTGDEQLSIASVSISDRTVDIVLADAVTPAAKSAGFAYLAVDDQGARRSIGYFDDSGVTTTVTVGDGGFDLDHLISSGDEDALHVAVLETTDAPTVTVGATADTHGNHAVPSTWWHIDPDPAPSPIESVVVYDADVSPGGSIVYATLEGLSIATGERIDLITSRAIRFVAA